MPARTSLSCLAALACAVSPAWAQGLRLGARRVATGIAQPVLAVSAPGDTARLFVVEQRGRIRILRLPSHTLEPTPFASLPAAGTNGMLGMTFHPDFQQNGMFYATHGTATGAVLVSGRVSSASPDLADDTSITTLLTLPVTGQHTGGGLFFGHDGYLYIPTGDGHNSARSQPLGELAGKVLRIDVDGADNIPGNADDDAFPEDASRNYSIPADNPFVGVADARPEIWARGLRNPYRTSIDPATGDIWIGDVGNFLREEIDVLPAGVGGLNLGWPIFEGTACSSGVLCGTITHHAPLMDYPRSGSFSGTTVIGGVVYRGCSMPWLRGAYLFMDFSRSWIAGVRQESGAVVAFGDNLLGPTLPSSPLISSVCLGTDARGEVYVVRYTQGEVWKLEQAGGLGSVDWCEGDGRCPADFNADAGVDVDDLLGFLDAFVRGALEADCDDDGDAETLRSDWAVTLEDLTAYLGRYALGC